jgi:hypothetical protein
VVPARPGRARPGRPRPRPEGCSAGLYQRPALEEVVPARAGVVRSGSGATTCARSRPRPARGWSGPRHPPQQPPAVVLARRGWCRLDADRSERRGTSSPPARGCSPHVGVGTERPVVVPARAGVVPAPSSAWAPPCSRPGLRGGGPWSTPRCSGTFRSSPPAQGWFLVDLLVAALHRVVPARAGVVLPGTWRPRPARSRPRPRGGHPYLHAITQRLTGPSPPARGWSGQVDVAQRAVRVVPARARLVRRRRPRPRGVVEPLPQCVFAVFARRSTGRTRHRRSGQRGRAVGREISRALS